MNNTEQKDREEIAKIKALRDEFWPRPLDWPRIAESFREPDPPEGKKRVPTAARVFAFFTAVKLVCPDRIIHVKDIAKFLYPEDAGTDRIDKAVRRVQYSISTIRRKYRDIYKIVLSNYRSVGYRVARTSEEATAELFKSSVRGLQHLSASRKGFLITDYDWDGAEEKFIKLRELCLILLDNLRDYEDAFWENFKNLAMEYPDFELLRQEALPAGADIVGINLEEAPRGNKKREDTEPQGPSP